MADDNLTRTVVSIMGQEFRIRGPEPEEYIRQLASFVDKKMRQIAQKHPNLPLAKVAVLAAINIADEYHKLQEDYDTLVRLIEEEKRTPGGGRGL